MDHIYIFDNAQSVSKARSHFHSLSLVRTLKDANFHKSFSRLSYTAPSHIGIEKKRNESGNIADSRVPLHNIFL